MPAQITALSTPPSTNDPANFNTRADAFLGQMPTFVTEANALASEVAASAAQTAADRVQTGLDRAVAVTALGSPGTNGSSATSLAIGTGTKTFTAQAGKAWAPGQGFFLASAASPLNWMSGILTAYNSGTGAATLEVDTVGGSGTFAAWNCGLAAGRPMALATQAQAEAGTDNTTVMTPLRAAQSALAFGTPIGGVLQGAINPGARWLPCTGLAYLNTAYPALSPSLPAYINPIALRQSATTTDKIYYGGGVFLAWAANGSTWGLYTSADGVTWTSRANPFGTSTAPVNCVFGAGLFVAYAGNTLYTSSDGVTWMVRSTPFSTIYGLGWSGSQFLMTGYANSGYYGDALSTNGTSWTGPYVDEETGADRQYVAYSPTLSRWVAFSSAWAYYATGANSWTKVSFSYWPAKGCVWGAGKFVVIGNGGIAYSTDGVSYTGASGSFPGVSWNAVFFDGARFFACGSNGVLVTSTNGADWTTLSVGAGTASVTGIARASSALTSPLVVAVAGLRSGLDASSTQFATPVVAPAAAGLGAYIKAA
ncbi:hypothetical protein [Caulobacter segnis]